MQFTEIGQIREYIESASNLKFESRENRLDRMRTLMGKLGNPQEKYKTVHIAGSKGKGSTCAYIASGLKALGYKTGLYLSPHVFDFRERFTLCDSFFSDDILLETANLMVEKIGNFKATVFELYTAFAFMLFEREHCDWAVIETGLGGRFDATNILNPQAVVLTPIELEHTEILGDTIRQIAIEKSKIIKKTVPVFVSEQAGDAQQVFIDEAKNNKSPIFFLKNCLKEVNYKITGGSGCLSLMFNDGFNDNFNLCMLGKVQAYNCALATLVLKYLGLYKQHVSPREIERTTLPARMEKINHGNTFFIDGAHTKKSIDNLVQTFRQIVPGKEGVCVFGCINDKKYKWMCQTILDNFNNIVVSKPGSYKQSNIQELYKFFMENKNSNQTVKLIEKSEDAITFCNRNKNIPVLICGSFYLAGEFIKILRENKEQKCL